METGYAEHGYDKTEHGVNDRLEGPARAPAMVMRAMRINMASARIICFSSSIFLQEIIMKIITVKTGRIIIR
jgi:hypothetical protein